ncbi:MAG TPA: hypothetical protein VMF89_21995, partial [Polyangiales bacterium]|nr:hypothetical protein [Polyangiales bacterium]
RARETTMPTYRNNRDALLFIESKHLDGSSVATMREIAAKATFAARSNEIPARWLAQGHPLEGPEPWVTQISAEPTDEDLSG